MGTKKDFNWIGLGAFLISFIIALGGFYSYCEDRFASKEVLEMEIEARREMKSEIDALYLKLIPNQERKALRFQE